MHGIRSLPVLILTTLYIKVETTGCKRTPVGMDYTGTKNVAIDGRTCALWTDSDYNDDDFPDVTVIAAKNYCRNPSKDENGLWCYIRYTILGFPASDEVFCNVPYCDPSLQEVGCKTTPEGRDYMGKLAITASGKPCQLWGLNSPHIILDRFWENNFPDGGMEQALNYCRNPDPDTEDVWCYTLDEDTRWEHCDVPMCVSTIMTSHPTTEKSGLTVTNVKTQTSTPHVTTMTQKAFTTEDQPLNSPSIDPTGSTTFSQEKVESTATDLDMTTPASKFSSDSFNSETTNSISQIVTQNDDLLLTNDGHSTEGSSLNPLIDYVSSKQSSGDTTVEEKSTKGISSSSLSSGQSSTLGEETMSDSQDISDPTPRDLNQNQDHMPTIKKQNPQNLLTQYFYVTNKNGIENDLKPTEEPLIILDDKTVEAAHAEVFGAFGMLFCLVALVMFALMDCDTYHKNFKMMKRNCKSRCMFRKRKIGVHIG